MQIRAARGALNWSVKQLAEATDVGAATIKRYELVEGVPPSRKGHLAMIKSVFEGAGIEFIGTPDNDPGIRIKTRNACIL